MDFYDFVWICMDGYKFVWILVGSIFKGLVRNSS